MGRLNGKVAIVTDAGTAGEAVGIGRAIAIVMGREGAMLSARAEATLATVRREGGAGVAVGGDMSSDADCRSVVETALDRYGRLDVLVNCARQGRS